MVERTKIAGIVERRTMTWAGRISRSRRSDFIGSRSSSRKRLIRKIKNNIALARFVLVSTTIL
jgi:hypothetical protein